GVLRRLPENAAPKLPWALFKVPSALALQRAFAARCPALQRLKAPEFHGKLIQWKFGAGNLPHPPESTRITVTLRTFSKVRLGSGHNPSAENAVYQHPVST